MSQLARNQLVPPSSFLPACHAKGCLHVIQNETGFSECIGKVGRCRVSCCGLWDSTQTIWDGFVLLILDRFCFVTRNYRIWT